jgi:hypothetical protein
MSVDSDVATAWREAALRLGVRVLAPHEIQLPDGGSVTVEAFLPDFGGPSGIAVVTLEDELRAKLADSAGVFVSQVSTDYRSFDEQLFRATLDDWGWHATASPAPPWYTGRPWS